MKISNLTVLLTDISLRVSKTALQISPENPELFAAYRKQLKHRTDSRFSFSLSTDDEGIAESGI